MDNNDLGDAISLCQEKMIHSQSTEPVSSHHQVLVTMHYLMLQKKAKQIMENPQQDHNKIHSLVLGFANVLHLIPKNISTIIICFGKACAFIYEGEFGQQSDDEQEVYGC